MKFNFNKPALLLSGKPVVLQHSADEPGKEQILGHILANNLVAQRTGNIMKVLDWARKLYAGHIIDLDRADQKTMQSLIEGFPDLSILYKGQLLEILDQKEEMTVAAEPR